jgi:hypothetical protein
MNDSKRPGRVAWWACMLVTAGGCAAYAAALVPLWALDRLLSRPERDKPSEGVYPGLIGTGSDFWSMDQRRDG